MANICLLSDLSPKQQAKSQTFMGHGNQQYNITGMILKLIIAALSVIQVCHQLCFNLEERDGSCTACGPAYTLQAGNCYFRIIGCSNFTANFSCIDCQFGYFLHERSCVKQKIAQKLPSYSPVLTFASKLDITNSLTYQQILERAQQKSGESFSAVHEYELARNPKLGRGLISDVMAVSAKTGKYFVIVYYANNNTRYQASSFVDSSFKVKQLEFRAYKDIEYQFNVVTMAKNVLPTLYKDLANYTLFEIVRQSENNYSFYYINSNEEFIKIMGGIGSAFNTDNLVGNFVNLTDLALEKILLQNPKWKAEQVKFKEKGNQYYVFKKGENTYVTAFFNGKNFVINNPTDPTPESPSLPVDKGVQPADSLISLGAYQSITDYQQPIFSIVFAELVKRISQLQKAKLNKAYFQVVQGLNYIMMLSAPGTEYEIRAFYSMQRDLTITYARRNRDIFYSEFYPFNPDQVALLSYLNFQSQIKTLAVVPAIKYMSLFRGTDSIMYRVVYNPDQSAEYAYNTTDGKVTPLSYNLYGVNRLSEMLRPDATQSLRISSYLSLLQESMVLLNTTSFSQVFIKNIVQANGTASIDVITPGGTYMVKVLSSPPASPIIQEMKLIFNSNCATTNVSDILTSDKISKAYSLLIQNYNLNEFSVTRVDVKLQYLQIAYRFLFINKNFKKIQAFVEEVYGTNTFNIQKVGYLNDGFEVISDNTLEYRNLYNMTLRMAQSIPWLKNKVPFYVEYNRTYLRCVFTEPRGAYVLSYDIIGNQAEVRPFNLTAYDRLPEFYFSSVIYPGQLSNAQNTVISNILSEVKKAYERELGAVSLLVVSKTQNSEGYSLLLNTSRKDCVVVQASVEPSKTTVGPYKKTNLKAEAISNCQANINNVNGACPSCQPDNQQKLEYQGSCYAVIAGCSAQVADYCLQCEPDYNKVGTACANGCELAFL